MTRLVVSFLTLCVVCCLAKDSDFLYADFPEGFLWGTATSSHQIEGAWNVSDKSENIWDRFSHDGKVKDKENADVACDSYHKYEEDVALLKELGVAHYRFSISWSRLLPNGTSDKGASPDGLRYYNALIDALKAAGIEPMVTLYHWDLPQSLQAAGGWENPEMIGIFENYARYCYEHFGDRVKWWITFNEPFVFTWLGYGIGVHAPGYAEPAVSVYKATHTVIRAHAASWHAYDKDFRPTQKGLISITLDCDWKEPKSQSAADIAAAERALQFKLGWFAHPIFVNGDYPEVMKTYVARKSNEEGLNASRLPVFTADEIANNKGTHDFFGLNHYTTQLIEHFDRKGEAPGYETDQDIKDTKDPEWPVAGSVWLNVVPWGLRRLLGWIKNNYNDPEVIITENGVSDNNGTLQDDHRISFYRDYINNVLKAVHVEKVRVIGYTAWSLLDNFEWASGYSERFGIHYVDYNDPNRARTPKASAKYLKQLFKDNGFVDPANSATRSKSGILGACLAFLLATLFLF